MESTIQIHKMVKYTSSLCDLFRKNPPYFAAHFFLRDYKSDTELGIHVEFTSDADKYIVVRLFPLSLVRKN
jgi:hypothetical protein